MHQSSRSTEYLKKDGPEEGMKPGKMVPLFLSRLTVWGGIFTKGVTPLIFVEGYINSERCCKILQEGFLESAVGQETFHLCHSRTMPGSIRQRSWNAGLQITTLKWLIFLSLNLIFIPLKLFGGWPWKDNVDNLQLEFLVDGSTRSARHGWIYPWQFYRQHSVRFRLYH